MALSDLVVVPEAASVEIGRTENAPLVVHDEDLAVQHAALTLVDVKALAKQPAIQVARGPLHDRHVALAGDDHADEDAALVGTQQLAEDPADGQEIGHR